MRLRRWPPSVPGRSLAYRLPSGPTSVQVAVKPRPISDGSVSAGLSREQGALAFHAEAIARQRAIAAHDAMAGDRYGERVRAAGLGDRPDRLRRSDAPRDLRVARCRTGRDLAQCSPDALLESGAANVERQVEPQAGRLDERHDLRNQPFERGVAGDQARVRKPILKIPRELVGIVAHEDGAHPAIALCDEDRPERALADGEAYFRVGTAGAVRGRRHAEHLVGFLVEPALRVVSGAVDGFGHRSGASELAPNPHGPMRRGIGFGSQAGDLLEDPMEVVGA